MAWLDMRIGIERADGGILSLVSITLRTVHFSVLRPRANNLLCTRKGWRAK